MELEVGTLFLRKYQVERLVGQGCMGRVYKARDQAIDRHVAIRLIEPEYDNERVLGFIEDDANRIGQARNLHLADCISVGILPSGERCIITEFVEGETLQRRMARVGRMSQMGVTQLLSQLLNGLAAAFAVGVVHRDLTPRSMFIAAAKPGPGHVARLIDFGLSRLAVLKADPSGSLATNSASRNSFQYLSPEQLNGLKEPDVRSNIYTLGVMAYQAITGQLPFTGDDFASLASNILLEEPTPIESLVPEASAQLVLLIRQAMARSPNARFQSAEEMLATVASLRDSPAKPYAGLESKPPPPPPPIGTDEEGETDAGADAKVGEAEPAPPAASSPKYPAPPLEQLSAARKYPAPPPPPPVDEPVPVPESHGIRPSQTTSPGIQPDTLSSPLAAEPPELTAPAVPAAAPTESESDVPAAVYTTQAKIEPAEPPIQAKIEPAEPPAQVAIASVSPPTTPGESQTVVDAPADPSAAPSTPATLVDRRPSTTPPASERPGEAQPTVSPEMVSNVRQRLDSLPPDKSVDLGAHARPAIRSRKPLVVAILLFGVVGAGIAFALIPGSGDPNKPIVPSVAPSAVVPVAEQVTGAIPPSLPEPTAQPVVSAVAIKPLPTATRGLALAKSASPAPASVGAGQKKSAPGATVKKSNAPKRDSAKDPYNYR